MLEKDGRKAHIGRILASAPAYVLLSLFLLVEILPLYFLLVNIFKTNMEFSLNQFALPKRLDISNLVSAWTHGRFLNAFGNSLILSVSGVAGQLGFGCLGAFAIALMRFKGRSAIYNFILFSMFLPPIVTIIPLYRIMLSLHLINTYLAPILIYVGNLPFTLYVIVGYFRSIPSELVDAATIDGCSNLKVFYKVGLPLIKAATGTIAIINVYSIWNDFLMPLVFLNSDTKQTLMVRVFTLRGRFITNIPVLLSGLFIALIPVLILFLVFQRRFIAGVTLGSFR